MAEAPEFIHRDTARIEREFVADYEARTGRTLQPSSVERLIINAIAYRETLVRSAIQEAAEQNLVEFSRAPVLDYLADLVGVTRLTAAPATCTLDFTIVEGHGGVTIPAGTRVQSADGLATFATLHDYTVETGETAASVPAEATEPGPAANGYVAGQISVILDPQAFISAAANADTTAGGAAQETDEALRERIKLAPASFSNAGSRGAYRFYAASANPSIIDVAVTNPVPGTVRIFPLLDDGQETPQQVLDAVAAACNAEDIRPLTDTVEVFAPARVDYTITAGLTIFGEADEAAVQAAVQTALEALARDKFQRMGIDITSAEVIKAAMQTGVYDVDITLDAGAGPVENILIDETEFGFATDINVTIDGTHG